MRKRYASPPGRSVSAAKLLIDLSIRFLSRSLSRGNVVSPAPAKLASSSSGFRSVVAAGRMTIMLIVLSAGTILATSGEIGTKSPIESWLFSVWIQDFIDEIMADAGG